jgi:uncharacterized protein YecT (DUF1311 family)
MRRFALVLTLGLAASAAHAETAAAPPPACDPARIGARELADCLRTAFDKSDRELASALDAALKSIDAKPKMLATRKARWKRFLNDSQTQWSSWRDEECQDLAPLEQAGAPGDPRLACLIDRNQRRAADLKARYP